MQRHLVFMAIVKKSHCESISVKVSKLRLEAGLARAAGWEKCTFKAQWRSLAAKSVVCCSTRDIYCRTTLMAWLSQQENIAKRWSQFSIHKILSGETFAKGFGCARTIFHLIQRNTNSHGELIPLQVQLHVHFSLFLSLTLLRVTSYYVHYCMYRVCKAWSLSWTHEQCPTFGPHALMGYLW